MFGYVTSKRELKTSKRVTMKDCNGEEKEYLVNVNNFEDLAVNQVAEATIEGDWKGVPIVTKLSYTVEGPEVDTLYKMYGPKAVPKLKAIMEDMINFINSTNDPSNIGGGPRTITFENLQKAIIGYFTDVTLDGTKVERLKDFVVCPASTIYHDSQKGGLLRHIAKCVQILIHMHESKYQEYEVHPLTLMIAAFVHDAGKIDQYEVDSSGAYVTTEWSSYRGSHIGMGLERWARHGRQFLFDLGVASCDIEGIYWDIWHIIGSHHGPVKNEMGSAWNPFGHDAWTIHSVDLLESRQEETVKPVRVE